MPRIVSLIASATEIVCALGFEGELVGRSHECDYPLAVRRLPVLTEPKFNVAGSSYEIDQRVKQIVAALQQRGFRSPYLRTYVVARINPVRFHKPKKGETKPPMPLPEALTRMAAAARRFDVASVRERDLALVAAVAGDAE